MHESKRQVLLLSFFILNYCGLVNGTEANIIAGLQWGSMRTYVKTADEVLHLEEDGFISGNILYSDGSTLMTTDGKATHLIAGSVFGYAEGRATQAQFRGVGGFLHTNPTLVLLADIFNHCIRAVNRLTNQTSTSVGKCTSSGYQDGQLNNALLSFPQSIIRDNRNPNSVIVLDHGNRALRSIELAIGNVKTLIKDLPIYPQDMTFDSKNESILIVFPTFLGKFNFKTSALIHITPSTNKGGLDGDFRIASFGAAERLCCMSNFCLIADAGASKLRILDFTIQKVYSICTGASASVDGTTKTCSLKIPWSLLLRSNTLYIGERGAIRNIAVRRDSPCKDITGSVLAKTQHTCIDVFPGHNICLPAGIFYLNNQEENCTIKINITREVDACQTLPCMNMGSCLAGENNTYSCTCRDGWTGRNCQTEEIKKDCPQAIFGVGDTETLKTKIILPHGDTITLPVGKFIYGTHLSDNTTCETVVHISDPRLTMRLDISANYKVPCNVYSNFEDPIQSFARTRYNHIKTISSGVCNQSPEYEVTMSCTNDVLHVVWPTNCLFNGSMIKQKEDTLSNVEVNLKKIKEIALDLFVPGHKPPIILPSPNPEGFPASVILTPLCTGGLNYVKSLELCQ